MKKNLKKKTVLAVTGLTLCAMLGGCTANLSGNINANVNGSEIISEEFEIDENGNLMKKPDGGVLKPGDAGYDGKQNGGKEADSEGNFPGGLDDDGKEPGEDAQGLFPGGLDDDGKGPDEDDEFKGVAVSASFDVINNTDQATQYAVITAYDMAGRTCWTYKTKEDGITELDRLQEIVMTDDLYIFAAFGEIIALNNADGSVAWTNKDFQGASLSWAMNNKGDTLYITGYYGPALFVMDFNGKTLNRIIVTDDEYYWPYEVLYVSDHQVDVKFYSNEKVYSIDPKGAKEQ